MVWCNERGGVGCDVVGADAALRGGGGGKHMTFTSHTACWDGGGTHAECAAASSAAGVRG